LESGRLPLAPFPLDTFSFDLTLRSRIPLPPCSESQPFSSRRAPRCRFSFVLFLSFFPSCCCGYHRAEDPSDWIYCDGAPTFAPPPRFFWQLLFFFFSLRITRFLSRRSSSRAPIVVRAILPLRFAPYPPLRLSGFFCKPSPQCVVLD